MKILKTIVPLLALLLLVGCNKNQSMNESNPSAGTNAPMMTNAPAMTNMPPVQ
jgi:hypothetical protein